MGLKSGGQAGPRSFLPKRPSWWRRLFWGEGKDQREIKVRPVEWKKESGKLKRSYPKSALGILVDASIRGGVETRLKEHELLAKRGRMIFDIPPPKIRFLP